MQSYCQKTLLEQKEESDRVGGLVGGWVNKMGNLPNIPHFSVADIAEVNKISVSLVS